MLTGRDLPAWQQCLALMVVLAMMATYIASPRMHEVTGYGLLDASGSGAGVYICLYSAAVTTVAAQILYVTCTFGLNARKLSPHNGLGRITIPFIVASSLTVAYGLIVGSLVWQRDPARIELSWWLATAAMTALAFAGIAGAWEGPCLWCAIKTRWRWRGSRHTS